MASILKYCFCCHGKTRHRIFIAHYVKNMVSFGKIIKKTGRDLGKIIKKSSDFGKKVVNKVEDAAKKTGNIADDIARVSGQANSAMKEFREYGGGAALGSIPLVGDALQGGLDAAIAGSGALKRAADRASAVSDRAQQLARRGDRLAGRVGQYGDAALSGSMQAVQDLANADAGRVLERQRANQAARDASAGFAELPGFVFE